MIRHVRSWRGQFDRLRALWKWRLSQRISSSPARPMTRGTVHAVMLPAAGSEVYRPLNLQRRVAAGRGKQQSPDRVFEGSFHLAAAIEAAAPKQTRRLNSLRRLIAARRERTAEPLEMSCPSIRCTVSQIPSEVARALEPTGASRPGFSSILSETGRRASCRSLRQKRSNPPGTFTVRWSPGLFPLPACSFPSRNTVECAASRI